MSDEELPEPGGATPRESKPGAMRYLAFVAAAAIGWISGRGSALVVPVGSFERSAVPAPSSAATQRESPEGEPSSSAASLVGSASSSAHASVVASAVAPEASGFPAELLARAERGELDAHKRIELRAQSERSIADARALVLGHGELTRRDGVRLVDDLVRDAAMWKDRAALARLVEFGRDPGVAPEVLAALARTGHPTAADILEELRLDFPAGSRLGLYAADLLFSADVRRTWSEPLRISIELSRVAGCPTVLELLERAREKADDRSLGALDRLGLEVGCGPNRNEDCFPCLREPERAKALVDVREVARSRVFERAWVLRKRH